MKLEVYNQKLLAVLGTVAVIFLIVGFISFITITLMEFDRFHHEVEPGILADEKIEELQKENKREQVISYENPRLIDTLNSIYVIPVSHKTLDEKEDINGLLNIKSSSSYETSDARYSNRVYGEFNNIIVYDSKKETNKKLFDTRVNFNQINTKYFEDDILLLMQVSEKDTYKDGVINLMDFNVLYIYSLKTKTLKRIGLDNMDVYNYRFLHNEKKLSILFGFDKNKDGQFVEYNEPTIVKKYDFNTDQLTDIIDKEINRELQQRLEGSIK